MVVNASNNYTKPSMRKKLVSKVKAGSKGGKPGQWSARKAQMVAKQYKAKGGGYKMIRYIKRLWCAIINRKCHPECDCC